jgi:hypothetical protein
VVRGGAFNNNEENARCAYRNRNNPNNHNMNNGFRVVVATFFSTQPELPGGRVITDRLYLPGRGVKKRRGLFLAALRAPCPGPGE